MWLSRSRGSWHTSQQLWSCLFVSFCLLAYRHCAYGYNISWGVTSILVQSVRFPSLYAGGRAGPTPSNYCFCVGFTSSDQFRPSIPFSAELLPAQPPFSERRCLWNCPFVICRSDSSTLIRFLRVATSLAHTSIQNLLGDLIDLSLAKGPWSGRGTTNWCLLFLV